MSAPDVQVPHGSNKGTIGSRKVTTPKLDTDAVTGPKLAASAFRMLTFTGRNLAGACTLTGAKVGDKVIGVANLTTPGNAAAKFEATITVANQIQQGAAENLSAAIFLVILVAKS